MSKLVLLSKEVIWDDDLNTPYPGVYEALQTIRENKHAIFLVSNHPKCSVF